MNNGAGVPRERLCIADFIAAGAAAQTSNNSRPVRAPRPLTLSLSRRRPAALHAPSTPSDTQNLQSADPTEVAGAFIGHYIEKYSTARAELVGLYVSATGCAVRVVLALAGPAREPRPRDADS